MIENLIGNSRWLTQSLAQFCKRHKKFPLFGTTQFAIFKQKLETNNWKFGGEGGGGGK